MTDPVRVTVEGGGSFELSAGSWTYILNNAAVQGLDAGQVVQDTYTFTASDGRLKRIGFIVRNNKPALCDGTDNAQKLACIRK